MNNYYGFKLSALQKRFGRGKFLGTVTVQDEYYPVAVYRVNNPDRSKGHKPIVLLQVGQDPWSQQQKLYVSGMELDVFEQWAKVEAIKCLKCKHIVYSSFRHDMTGCKCRKNKVFIDGGRDYCKINSSQGAKFQYGTYCLLTGKFTSSSVK